MVFHSPMSSVGSAAARSVRTANTSGAAVGAGIRPRMLARRAQKAQVLALVARPRIHVLVRILGCLLGSVLGRVLVDRVSFGFDRLIRQSIGVGLGVQRGIGVSAGVDRRIDGVVQQGAVVLGAGRDPRSGKEWSGQEMTHRGHRAAMLPRGQAAGSRTGHCACNEYGAGSAVVVFGDVMKVWSIVTLSASGTVLSVSACAVARPRSQRRRLRP